MTLAIRGCLWAHECGWMQIAHTYKWVMLTCDAAWAVVRKDTVDWKHVPSSSMASSCCMIRESWLVHGNRQMTKLGRKHIYMIDSSHVFFVLFCFLRKQDLRIRHASPGITRLCCLHCYIHKTTDFKWYKLCSVSSTACLRFRKSSSFH